MTGELCFAEAERLARLAIATAGERTVPTSRAVRSATSPRCSPAGGGNEAAAALEQTLEGYERKKTLPLGDALPRLVVADATSEWKGA